MQSQKTAAVVGCEHGPHYLESNPFPALGQPVSVRECEESCSLRKSNSADASHSGNEGADTEAFYFVDMQGEQYPTSWGPTAGGGVEHPAEVFEIVAQPNASHFELADDMEKLPSNRKRPRDESVDRDGAREASPQVVEPDAKPDALELNEALLRMKEYDPHDEFMTIVRREIHLSDDFQTSSPADRVAAIRTLAAGIKTLSAAPMCKHGSEITHKQRLMVAGVIVEAVACFTKFVVATEPSSKSGFDASELLAMLDCIGSTKGVFRDSKATLARYDPVYLCLLGASCG